MEKTLSSIRLLPGAKSLKTLWDQASRKILFSQLEKLTHGKLTLRFAGATHVFGGKNETMKARITVHHPAFFSKVVFGGSVGAGESYMDGDWEADNLPEVIRIMTRNREITNGIDSGWSLVKRPVLAALHALNRNTVQGSARNIAAHYDLGNEFFSQFLDKTMMYSCAWFYDSHTDLQTASESKLDRICLKLDLKPGDRVVEIGSGWGSFAVHAAKNYGCHVTTTTISQQQYDRCIQLVKKKGVEDRVTVLKKDYREMTGTYDKLVSIEMIEAVGHQYLNEYMATCSKLLKENGVMLIQAITINDQFYDQAVNSVDFIKRYIFPGSFIPSVSAIMDAMKHHTNLRLFHLEDITPHYAETLKHWRANFHKNHDEIHKLGFSETFMRMWDFYFSYCEGGFRERAIGCAHLVFTKPLSRIQKLSYE